MGKLGNKNRAAEQVPLLVADVYEAAGAFRRWGDSMAGRLGQTQAGWQVLSAASAGERTVAQLARRLGITRQSVQRTADRLVADRLAHYADNIDNRRSPHLRLTSAGKRVLAKLTFAARDYHRQLAEGLSAEDLEIALVVVRKMCMQLQRDASSSK